MEALEKGYTHYTHWAGMIELREGIAHKLRVDNALRYDPKEEIVVTAGVEEPCMSSVRPFLTREMR